jgi:hypothetical protein
MNSTPPKVFRVGIMNCKNRSHARKVAELLRGCFPHREFATADEPSTNFTIMVKADSLASIQTAISSALGKAQPEFAGIYWFSGKELLSPEPPDYLQFAPPTSPR